MHNGSVIWEDSLVVSSEIIFLYHPATVHLGLFPKELKLRPHKNLHTNVEWEQVYS